MKWPTEVIAELIFPALYTAIYIVSLSHVCFSNSKGVEPITRVAESNSKNDNLYLYEVNKYHNFAKFALRVNCLITLTGEYIILGDRLINRWIEEIA